MTESILGLGIEICQICNNCLDLECMVYINFQENIGIHHIGRNRKMCFIDYMVKYIKANPNESQQRLELMFDRGRRTLYRIKRLSNGL
jgi:hypothetical protein